ncbi:MAG: glutamate racemase [Candidatus Marinamargulisbacteria bacterium]
MIKIGIYDSGCGGFTVLNELMAQSVNCPVVYYGDSGNNPWGNKPKDELQTTLNVISTWFKSQKVTHVITGCNTTVGLFKNTLLHQFNRPVMTLFDNTIQHYREQHYTVFSTESSTKSRLFSNFLTSPNHHTIQEIACPDLAYYIETNQLERAMLVFETMIKKSMHPHIILGCTHYALLLNKLNQVFPQKNWVNPASFIHIPPDIPRGEASPNIAFFTSGNIDTFKQQINQYTPLKSYEINGKKYKLI